MLWTYIDDSGSKESHLLTLSALTSDNSMWIWFELRWQNCIDIKNEELRKQGRKEITRYHASDCSFLHNEFEGWTPEEQRQFTSSLIRVFQRHGMFITSYTLDLRDLIAEFPEADNDEYGASALGHIILLSHIMEYLSKTVLSHEKYLTLHIALVNERGSFDTVLAEAFRSMLDKRAILHWERFASIESDGWETCTRLQPTDLIAYENYKLVERRVAGKPRRKAMELILDLDSIGGRGSQLTRAAFSEIRSKHTPESLKTLFTMARMKRRTL